MTTMPAHQRPPFGWPTIAIDAEGARLDLPSLRALPAALRIAVAVDVREPARIDAFSSAGAALGTFDCRYACALQMFDLPLPERVDQVILRPAAGVSPLFIFAPETPEPAFRPQLIAATATAPPLERMLGRLDSLASVTQYGWMEACVLDGLFDLGRIETLRRHLDLFFPGDRIVCEDFRSRPSDGKVLGSETTNMFAALARLRPDHPAIDACIAHLQGLRRPNDSIRDGAIVAEHNYTVAYTLAAIGQARGEQRLLHEAIRQLQIRTRHLRDADAIWLRRFDDGRRTFRNWSRGCTWYLLGLARTLEIVGDLSGAAELQRELADGCRLVLRHQRDSGLWGSFIDEPETLDETSGSAGIAAACAIAARHGWLEPSARQAGERALAGLQRYILPDGMLHGMSQSNKAEGAQDLQRCPFRVIGPCAMGLAAQLIAALNHQANS